MTAAADSRYRSIKVHVKEARKLERAARRLGCSVGAYVTWNERFRVVSEFVLSKVRRCPNDGA
jgi:hypothetical protein